MWAAFLCLGLPWAAPDAPPIGRFLLGFLAWVAIGKALDLWRGTPSAQDAWGRPVRVALWLVMPPQLRWPADDTERDAVVRQGRARLAWGLVKLCAFAATWLLRPTHLPPPLTGVAQSAWGLSLCYFALAGAADVVTSLPMLGGVHVAETFRKPFLARSPRDLWHGRWNLWFHRLIGRHVFRPLRRRPALAVTTSFLASGLAHEYLVLAALGRTDFGMLSFFALQGAAVIAQKPLSRRLGFKLPPALAWGLHTAWLLLTAPLLLAPAFRIAGLAPL